MDSEADQCESTIVIHMLNNSKCCTVTSCDSTFPLYITLVDEVLSNRMRLRKLRYANKHFYFALDSIIWIFLVYAWISMCFTQIIPPSTQPISISLYRVHYYIIRGGQQQYGKGSSWYRLISWLWPSDAMRLCISGSILAHILSDSTDHNINQFVFPFECTHGFHQWAISQRF